MTSPKEADFCETCGKPQDDGQFVTLSKAEFQKLQNTASKASKKPLNTNRFRRLGKSSIYRNAPLAEFILACSGNMLLAEIRAACIAKFGKDAAPSVSAIQRFLARLPKSFSDTQEGAIE